MSLKFNLAKGTSEETRVTANVLMADTDLYDVILGTDFLGACFGYMDPLKEDFLWRVGCHEIEQVPSRLAQGLRLNIKEITVTVATTK